MTSARKKKNELAQLKAELAKLKAKVEPAPYVGPSVGEWQDQMRAFSEARAAQAMPPSAVRDMAVLDDALVKGIALRDARAPVGPCSPGAIPASAASAAPRGSGWVAARPLTPPAGIDRVDALCIADDLKQRAERKRAAED